jgi:hypothetical protein
MFCCLSLYSSGLNSPLFGRKSMEPSPQGAGIAEIGAKKGFSTH